MRADWEEMQGGRNARRTGVLDQDIRYQQISINQEDSQFLDTKKLSIQQICGLFRCHPSQIGDISRVAGETYQGQQLTFLRDCLRPIMNRITQELIRKLLPNQREYVIAYEVRDFLKLDAKTQMESLMTATSAGLLTTDEGREMAGLNPIGGELGSVILAPVNFADARMLIGKTVSTPTASEVTDAA